MTPTTCHMSISLDGFVAGPDQSRDNPLGIGGRELHRWHLDEPFHEADARVRDELMTPCGAYVMGRNMFGPVRGPWDVNVAFERAEAAVGDLASTSPLAPPPCGRRSRRA